MIHNTVQLVSSTHIKTLNENKGRSLDDGTEFQPGSLDERARADYFAKRESLVRAGVAEVAVNSIATHSDGHTGVSVGDEVTRAHTRRKNRRLKSYAPSPLTSLGVAHSVSRCHEAP